MADRTVAGPAGKSLLQNRLHVIGRLHRECNGVPAAVASRAVDAEMSLSDRAVLEATLRHPCPRNAGADSSPQRADEQMRAGPGSAVGGTGTQLTLAGRHTPPAFSWWNIADNGAAEPRYPAAHFGGALPYSRLPHRPPDAPTRSRAGWRRSGLLSHPDRTRSLERRLGRRGMAECDVKNAKCKVKFAE